MTTRPLILIAIAITGCATSRDLSTASRTVQVREEMAGGKVYKLRTVTTTNASEQEAVSTAPDGALIGAQIADAIGVAIKAAFPAAAPVAQTIDWGGMVAAGGAAATAAASGYLALKKREQIRTPKPPTATAQPMRPKGA
jgi:hypothetical protein